MSPYRGIRYTSFDGITYPGLTTYGHESVTTTKGGKQSFHIRPGRRPAQLDDAANTRDREGVLERLGFDGAWIFKPRIHQDLRGSILEWFRGAEVAAQTGHYLSLAQANWSVSHRGV